ncbi:sure-like protein [Mycena crocata]|nr:sure-like protein [Mycena crocata]
MRNVPLSNVPSFKLKCQRSSAVTLAMMLQTVLLATLSLTVSAQTANKILLTNDDGWAVAQVRAQNDALKAAGYNICRFCMPFLINLDQQVVLLCPAINKSGTGSSTTNPPVLTSPCEFNTCPTGSPAEGFNASDTRVLIFYEVDAARFGIFFGGSEPDFVVAGPNVGTNLGLGVLGSGTVLVDSVLLRKQRWKGYLWLHFLPPREAKSRTPLSHPPPRPQTAGLSALTMKLVNVLLASPAPILPRGIVLNVNYPSTSSCTSAAAFKFVLTRINSNSGATDVQTCGTTHLPTESSVVAKSGCFASVSVFNASTKRDVGAATQAVVLAKLGSLLACACSN